MKQWFQVAAAAAALLGVWEAAAQPAGRSADPLEVRLETRKVVGNPDGTESFLAAESAKPGDILEYVATYRNRGAAALRDVSPQLPVPANTEFVPGSARPPAAAASLDGSTFAPMPLSRKAERNGAQVDVPVPPREYRSLRWSVAELAPGKTTSVSARVRVLDDRSTGPPAAAGGRQ